ncbi:MAG: (deoxy)nucleoside triphosphate pyrophosphohydrolase [Planctomycetaceae bacterium]
MKNGDHGTADEPPQPIGIAVVIYDRRVLVGVRGPDGPLPGLAEFPGGKCDPGESPIECAVRECREETGLDVLVETELADLVWQYSHRRVHLYFVHCRPKQDEDVQPFQQGFRWVAAEELSLLDFPEANQQLVGRIQKLLRQT